MTQPSSPTRQARGWWADRRIRTKVLAPAVVASLVATTVGLLGLNSLSSSAETSERIYANNLAAVKLLGDLDVTRKSISLSIRDLLLVPNGEERQAVEEEYAGLQDTFRSQLDEYAATDPATADLATLESVREGLEAYLVAIEEKLVPLAEAGDEAGWWAMNSTDLVPLAKAVGGGLGELKESEQAQAADAASDARSSYDAARQLAIILLVVGLLTALGFAFLVARGVTTSIGRLQQALRALAGGDLTVDAGVSSRDEVGRMAADLETARESLHASLSAMGDNTVVLASAAEEMSAVSAQLGASASESSTQAQLVSAAAEEVSSNVQTVAAGSEQMGASIREIAQNASDAARVATQAVVTAEETTATVAKLGESSAEIGSVVKAITSIAEQTNLLALNATIEAARAGEAGKGFAVVANEVKELAVETARATEDIAKRVEAIQADTGGAVTAIGEITEIISRISDYQNTIAAAVEEQTATTNEISRNVAEAATGATEIARNVGSVSEAADQTTDAAGNTTAAAGDLTRMATEMRDLVGRFRL
ncbi:methyl-accepting chemotaxis protein [Nocardioides lianchengensis]|uniref:Methyl-accepting chemotaxis protein n=1 Tax=Nocardioides lianchengensis TaxID=1045774 RepID=A0A1G6L031_9ACTN|nr:methyl-accepting chemotaxis protein [Nocardioides lianchengensis]NYG13758.1 methyl-accepting chemotaxis protein [Nocardioides lianchengensis]SDC36428.1 methyl-accepting chemotaxis protein [Nocardioides lianchengensis]